MVLFVADVVWLDQGIVTFLVALSFLLRAGGSSITQLFQQRPIKAAGWKQTGVYSFFAVAALAAVYANGLVAKERSSAVVAAVKQYKAKYRSYPPALESLVPEFLAEIPAPKVNLSALNRFLYFKVDGSATLLHTQLLAGSGSAYQFDGESTASAK
ncbi:MAG TPA: hypothetical protein VIH99_00090 [Bdellovibrionota bacterium]|jgi:hypothetical protein